MQRLKSFIKREFKISNKQIIVIDVLFQNINMSKVSVDCLDPDITDRFLKFMEYFINKKKEFAINTLIDVFNRDTVMMFDCSKVLSTYALSDEFKKIPNYQGESNLEIPNRSLGIYNRSQRDIEFGYPIGSIYDLEEEFADTITRMDETTDYGFYIKKAEFMDPFIYNSLDIEKGWRFCNFIEDRANTDKSCLQKIKDMFVSENLHKIANPIEKFIQNNNFEKGYPIPKRSNQNTEKCLNLQRELNEVRKEMRHNAFHKTDVDFGTYIDKIIELEEKIRRIKKLCR